MKSQQISGHKPELFEGQKATIPELLLQCHDPILDLKGSANGSL